MNITKDRYELIRDIRDLFKNGNKIIKADDLYKFLHEE